MASLLEEGFNSEPANDKQSVQSSFKCINLAAVIDGNHTDIVINEYHDRLFIILSQFKKLGALVCVTVETAKADEDCGVYKVRTILGKEDISQDVAARYLAEQTRMTKPALFSICLKDDSLRTLEAIRDIVERNKSW